MIVVDNGSDDDSAAVARAAGAQVLTESTTGIAAASATGYDAGSGSIIARLDADSVPAPDWIAVIVKTFEGDPSLRAVTGAATFTDGPRWLRGIGSLLYLGSYFALVGLALGHPPLFGSNCAFRSSTWRRLRDRVHRDDPMVHDDMDLSYHLDPARPVRRIPNLRVGVSGRPFSGAGTLRIARAVHTISLHWPSQLPWLRIIRRLRPTRRRPDYA